MIYTFCLPDIGEGVVEGEVVQWLKNIGEAVRKDEAVVVVMTDKATVELPSPHPGILETQHYRVGQIAKKDYPLFDIRLEHPLESVVQQELVPIKEKAVFVKPIEVGQGGLAIPKCRHFAKQLNISLDQVQGSGPGGRVEMSDLLSHIKKQTLQQPYFEGDKEVALVGVKRLMAERMALSKDTIPHFSYFESFDATSLLKMKEKFHRLGEKENVKVTFMPFLIRALSLTIDQFPQLNSSFNSAKQCIILHSVKNVGFAASTRDGLRVVVLKNVEKLSLEEIIRSFAALMQKVKENTLERSHLIDSTITLSNFGPLGDAEYATPIINPPEAAILGVAKIAKRAVVRNDQVIALPTLPLSWSFDHRIIDGELAGKISTYFIHLLKQPSLLLN